MEENEIVVVEVFVLWYMEGKGDEDFGFYFFECWLLGGMMDGDLWELRWFEIVCLNSLFSYEGEMIKLCWCVCVCVFLLKVKEIFFEFLFMLGDYFMMFVFFFWLDVELIIEIELV